MESAIPPDTKLIFATNSAYPVVVYMADLNLRMHHTVTLLGLDNGASEDRPKEFDIPPSSVFCTPTTILFTGGGNAHTKRFFTWATSVAIAIEKSDGFELVNSDLTTQSELDSWSITASSLEPMTVSKAFHSLVAIDWGGVLSVGGRTENGVTGKCEQFSLIMNKWMYEPTLNFPREQVALCMLSGRTIYAISGVGADSLYSNKVERFDFAKSGAEWNEVVFSTSDGAVPPLLRPACMDMENDKILIAGGYLDEYKTSYTHVFDKKAGTVEKGPALPRPMSFPFGTISYDKTRCAVDSELNILVYQTKDETMKLILKEKWIIEM